MTAEAVAEFVVENGLAVIWSQRIDVDPEAGKKGRSGWNTADPWPKQNKGGLIAHLDAYRGQRNLLVVTRPSNVITIDCDTQAGLEKYWTLGLPQTVTIKSGRDGSGYHFIFRPPGPQLSYSFFELAGDEAARVTGASSTKLHVLWGYHKTGREYEILEEHGLEIATMPGEVYDRLEAAYGRNHRRIRSDIPQGKLIPPSGRHDYLLGQASFYSDLGHRGPILRAHLRVDWDMACEPDTGRDIDAEINRIAAWAEGRYVQDC